jgi:hypothetical protein
MPRHAAAAKRSVNVMTRQQEASNLSSRGIEFVVACLTFSAIK